MVSYAIARLLAQIKFRRLKLRQGAVTLRQIPQADRGACDIRAEIIAYCDLKPIRMARFILARLNIKRRRGVARRRK